ncbi:family 78 glycoside hydrolase catalytic domain [Micromonospora halotolerans]|uniref:alpha-L-rhamnosidase n=1 Tax=Micromonospora halotolerans TaxID=709879 RepID=A0ABY9ZVF6_9ACTN|nr:family 78 glycoside hydrolase catalytic domain [Micromonospora halotolerans]WNM39274.1 family 78 glycoside hydrolase catalytic domain [Micromonospora halotolerans]
MTPYGLETEQRPEPLGVGERLPRLSWKLASDRRGATQSAYRLTAAERAADLADPDRLIWDTGRRECADTILIPWDGPALRSATRYHWRVQVWDETGAEAGAAQSWFETGLLHHDDWTATWVGRDPAVLPYVEPPGDDDRPPLEAPPLYLRREFHLDRPPVRARLYATARGVYEPRLNGVRVGDAELAPGWTEYHRRLHYQTYDVTELLHPGANALAAIVADGWWCGYVGFDARRPAQHYGDQPAFLAQLVVDFADGSRQVVATDGAWGERPGAIRSADLLMGEYVDRRQHVPGWDTAGAAAFLPVAVLDPEPGPLVAEPDHPIRVILDVPAIDVHQRAPGRYIVDFGQNLVGRVRLTVRGAPAGHRIVVRHAEMLADGELYTDNLRTAKATDMYLAGGDEVEVFEPRFTFHGFRYVEVDNLPGELAPTDIVARVLHNDTPLTGRFECSDPMVNQLQSNITWGQRGNFIAVPTDCPQRDERLGWLADAQIFAPTSSRNADVSAFLARWLRDVVNGQDAQGAFRDVAPVVALHREAAPAWGDAGVIIPWHLWRAYGDRRVLERSYDSMLAWVRYVHRHNPDLRWRHRTGNSYGDWLQVDVTTPREVLATAYFARSTQLTAEAADVLGRHDDAARLRDLHAGIRAAFIDSYVAADGTVEGGTQTAYLLALAFGLLPQRLVPAAVGHLAADIEKRDHRLTTGFVGVALLCPVLSDHGRADLAYALLHQEEFPSWGYSIRHGATTIWERWDGWTDHAGFQSPAMNSFNHYSLGSVGDWLYGRVAGIDQAPSSVAYRELLLRPLPGGRLRWARAEQETARGRVVCGWSISDGRLTVTATVPPGCTAVLQIPTPDPDSVRENDAPAAGRPGVLGVETYAAGVTLRLTSGRYTVTATAPDVVP